MDADAYLNTLVNGSNGKDYLLREASLKLIECVRQRPVLWHRQYLRRRATASVIDWEDIQHQAFASQSVNQLKVRWKTLRDTFRREAKRIEDGEASSSRWALYEHMQFLLGHFRIKQGFRRSGKHARHQRVRVQRKIETPKPEESSEASGSFDRQQLGSSIAANVENFEQTDTESYPPEVANTFKQNESYQSEGNLVRSNTRSSSNSCDGFGFMGDDEMGCTTGSEEVTFRNKFRTRIKSGASVRHDCSDVVEDPDFRFLTSLTPFLNRLPSQANLQIRIQILQLVSNALQEVKTAR